MISFADCHEVDRRDRFGFSGFIKTSAADKGLSETQKRQAD